MSKKFYVAYGSNLNIEQMMWRCPTAKFYSTGVIEDYELQFKGSPNCAFATISPCKGSKVPAAVWEIEPRDEMSLDRYEGYPSHYFKENVKVKLDGKEINAMVYIMNLKMNFGIPTLGYYRIVKDGYRNCNFDTSVLDKAVSDSVMKYYQQSERIHLLDNFHAINPNEDNMADEEETELSEFDGDETFDQFGSMV